MYGMRRLISYRIVCLYIAFAVVLSGMLFATRKKASELVNEAKVLIERGDLKKAFLKLQKACEEDELFDEPRYHLARIHYLKNDVELAMVEIKKALSLAPHEAKYKKLQNYFFYKCRAKLT